MTDTKDLSGQISLLSQRLKSLEERDATQEARQREIDKGQNGDLTNIKEKLAKIEGASDANDKTGDWIKKMAPVVFGTIILGGIAFLWGNIVEVKNTLTDSDKLFVEDITFLKQRLEYFEETKSLVSRIEEDLKKEGLTIAERFTRKEGLHSQNKFQHAQFRIDVAEIMEWRAEHEALIENRDAIQCMHIWAIIKAHNNEEGQTHTVDQIDCGVGAGQ